MILPSRAEILPYIDRLKNDYITYTANVSPRSMALPIETAAFAWAMCDQLEAVAVADLGSGISSHVLRRYAEGTSLIVHSVDDDPYWLHRSQDYCSFMKDDTAGFMSDTDWLTNSQTYDLIIHDLAGGGKREEFAAHALDRLNPGGVVIFDDAHNHGHHHRFAEVCRQRGMTLVDVWHQTIEEAGRYAAMGVRL